MRQLRPELRALGVLALAAAGTGCMTADAPRLEEGPPPPAFVGSEPVPRIHLFENNSSALIAWRRAGVRDRILVHLDGHADLDWLPDESIAYLAAARPAELADLEQHPYSMRDGARHGFSSENFIYPASRLGLVRALVWVVPDGTLKGQPAAYQLIRTTLIDRVQRVRLEEARTLRFDRRVVRGDILGLPILICELGDLPEIDEPVLLDIDLDYFTTRSAVTQRVGKRPWTTPRRVLRALGTKGVQTDLVTISLSTIGGFVPPTERWIGRELRNHLRDPHRTDEQAQRRLKIDAAVTRGELELALGGYRRLVESEPENATVWLAMSLIHDRQGEPEQAARARQRAAELDPLLEHGDLFFADYRWINREFEAALALYRRYLERFPQGPFSAYARRKQGGCLARLGHRDDALATLRAVVEVAPGHADSRLELGLLLLERGALDDALRHLQAARRLVPERAVYAHALGTTYLRHGMLEEGVRELEHVVQSHPALASARGMLGEALLRLGRHEEAASHVRLALSFHPNDPRLRALERELTRVGAGR